MRDGGSEYSSHCLTFVYTLNKKTNTDTGSMAFINDGWADRALTLGWTMNELFGVDALAPWARLDRLGAAYLAKNIVAVTDRTMTLNASQGSRLTLRRNQKRAGQAYPWQVIEGQLSSGPLRHPHVRAGGTE